MTTPLHASAPAKVNLHLAVGAALPNGYHPLTTIFEALGLRDYVTATRRTDADVTVRTLLYSPVVGAGYQLDERATNRFSAEDGPGHLAVRAARALLQPGQVGADLVVHKTIPVAGGMAGGSADAAATLVLMDQLLSAGLSQEQLQKIGSGLGADVPACLVGGVSLGLGVGDNMSLLRPGTCQPTSESDWWVLARSHHGLSTPEVFGRFDQMVEGGQITPDPAAGSEVNWALAEGLTQLDAASPDQVALQNDLQVPAFTLRPELREVGEAALEAGARTWVLSGSGPTIAALAHSRRDAEAIATKWAQAPGVAQTLVTWGPAVGARMEPALPAWALA